MEPVSIVSILVIVEVGFKAGFEIIAKRINRVSILVIVEVGFKVRLSTTKSCQPECFNPCYSGSWF